MRKVFILSCIICSSLISSAQIKEARLAYKRGNYSEAIKLFEKSTLSDNRETSLEGNLGVARCHIGLGDYKRSLDLLVSIPTDKYSDTQNGEKALLIGESHQGLGRNDLAINSFKEAEVLFGEGKTKNHAECYKNLGLAYRVSENYDLSIKYQERALDINTSLFGKESIECANIHNNQGLVYTKQEEFFNALICYNKAKEIYTTQYGQSHPKVANTLTNLAVLDGKQGNYEQAIEKFEKVREIYNNLYQNDHPNKAFITLSIGEVHHYNQKYDEALSHFNQAMSTYVSLFGKNHPEVINIHTLKAKSFFAQGRYHDALKSYQEAIYANFQHQDFEDLYALPQLENYISGDALLTALQEKARVWEAIHFNKTLKKRDIDASLETIKLADQLVTKIQNVRINEADKINLGKISSELYEDGIELCDYLIGLSGNKAKYLEQAFYFFERSKSSVLLSAINDTKAKSFAGIPQHLLVIEDSLKTQLSFLENKLIQSVGTNTEDGLRSQLLQTNNRYQAFIKQLEVDYPKYFDLKYDVSLSTIKETQIGLSDGAAIVSYFIADNKGKIFIFYIDKKKAMLHGLSKDPKLNRSIHGLRNGIKYKSAALFKQSSKLYDQLIPKKLIKKGILDITIIPEGTLTSVPFEVLSSSKTEKNGDLRYLIQDYSISYANSVTLLNSNNKSSSEETNLKKGGVLIAPIDFKASRLNSLPGSGEEINSIKTIFGGKELDTKQFKSRDASETNIKKLDFNDYDYIHFATHGLVNESEPKLSRIFLTPDGKEDGSLYSSEIYNLSVKSKLVCLSACETGQGKIEKGEGLVGLSRALSYAGAENLIVSLWAVSDNSTASLMIDFYKNHLLKGYTSFSAALRKAKLKLLASEDFNEPYYWAPFVLISN